MGTDRSFLVTFVMSLGMISVMSLVTATLLAAGAEAQSLTEIQQKFDREENSVRKAKLIEKLGDAQFDALHAAEKAEDYNTVGVTLEKYRDNVRVALAGLKVEHPDAERRSNGYRQLQIHVHHGVREVEEALRSVPDEFKPPLQLVRADLIAMDDELLQLLFPKRPETKPEAKPEAQPGTKPSTNPGSTGVQQ